mgnify:CR=1 FL=1
MSNLSSQFGGDAAKAGVAVSGATYAVVLGPIDVQNYVSLGVYVENAGGGSGDNLASVIVETAPVVTGPWIVVGEVLSGPLAADDAVFDALEEKARKFVRLSANCADDEDTTVNLWLCAARYGR